MLDLTRLVTFRTEEGSTPEAGIVAGDHMNYRDHAHEAGLEIPSIPTIFSKFSKVVIGAGAPGFGSRHHPARYRSH